MQLWITTVFVRGWKFTLIFSSSEHQFEIKTPRKSLWVNYLQMCCSLILLFKCLECVQNHNSIMNFIAFMRKLAACIYTGKQNATYLFQSQIQRGR